LTRILVVDDDRNIRRMLAATLDSPEQDVTEAESANAAIESLAAMPYDVVISDVRMPGMNGMQLLEEIKRRDSTMPVIMMTAFGTIPDAVEAIRLGAYDYLTKPFSAEHLRRIVSRALELQNLKTEVRTLRSKLERLGDPEEFLIPGPNTRRLDELARNAAVSDATVLLIGESGTGKNLLARHIHVHSPRSAGPFVEVPCITLNEELLESELFGHVRGSFVGAVKDKPGRLEAANGGTVFLDEIAELSLPLQAKLLRFLQEKVFERVGSAEPMEIDVRIIAATNQNIEELVREKRFREDLYYRLNVIELRVPPLRERTGEIPPLAAHFIEQAAARHHQKPPRLSAEAAAALLMHPWPGNIRELRNVIERAVVLSRGPQLELTDLPDRVVAREGVDRNLTLEELERRHIESVIQHAMTFEEAADMLGINVATLWRKRRRYGFK
jgi:NtrC-family two-component system response regulator AlgB